MSDSTPAIVRIPFQGSELLTVEVEGKPYVVLKPAFEALGLNADEQIERVTKQAWATTRRTPVVAQDGKIRQMIVADCRTFLGALMTVTVSRVKPELRETLTRYQVESLDAIEAHWYGDKVKTAKQLQEARSKTNSMMKELGALRQNLDIVREDAYRLQATMSDKDARINALESRQAQASIRDSIERYIQDEFVDPIKVDILDEKPADWDSPATWAKANLIKKFTPTRDAALIMLVTHLLEQPEARGVKPVFVRTPGRRVDLVYPHWVLAEASRQLMFT